MNNRIIAIDFDGTIVKDNYPQIGELKDNAVFVINKLKHEGYHLILWTSRTGFKLAQAVEFLTKNGITFHGYNESCPASLEKYGDIDTRKIYADLYIDDKILIRPVPEWTEIYEMIHQCLPTYADKVAMEGYL